MHSVIQNRPCARAKRSTTLKCLSSMGICPTDLVFAVPAPPQPSSQNPEAGVMDLSSLNAFSERNAFNGFNTAEYDRSDWAPRPACTSGHQVRKHTHKPSPRKHDGSAVQSRPKQVHSHVSSCKLEGFSSPMYFANDLLVRCCPALLVSCLGYGEDMHCSMISPFQSRCLHHAADCLVIQGRLKQACQCADGFQLQLGRLQQPHILCKYLPPLCPGQGCCMCLAAGIN